MEIFADDLFGGGGFGGLGGFLGGMGGSRRRGPARGEDTVHKLNVTLEELYVGKVSKLQLSKTTICPDCNGNGGFGVVNPCGECRGRGIVITVNQIGPGMVQQMQSKCTACDGEGEVMADSDRCKACSGRKVVPDTKLLEVRVEPGMRDHQKIMFQGEGNHMPGVEPGNVIIVIVEKQHKNFKRDGNDLILTKEITLTEALCGFKMVITQLDGRGLVIVQGPGEVFKPNTNRTIVGEGMPGGRDGQKGDLHINFKVEFPTNYFAPDDKLKLLERLLGGRSDPGPIPEDAEEVNLSEVEESHTSRDSDDDEMRGHPHGANVQCAQQ